MKLKKGKIAEKGKNSFVTFFQTVYLTHSSYLKNDLYSYASACTFGFLFSFIPTAMLTLVILIRILHLSPESLTAFIGENFPLILNLNLNNFVTSITQIKKITSFEIVIGFAIIMMARRFFSSVMSSMTRIFGHEKKINSVFRQVLIFLGELIMVVVIATMIFAFITANTINRIPILTDILEQYPGIHAFIKTVAHNSIPLSLMFVLVTIVYREASSTKPKFLHCMILSGATTLTFGAFIKFMRFFINVNKYNIVYGVLSNTIVLLLEVYFFFVIFLFFAQWLFVSQFFDTLLICELYLLPGKEETTWLQHLKRVLFINPSYLMKKGNSKLDYKQDEIIYSVGDTENCVYYLYKGEVLTIHDSNEYIVTSGDFFGIEACLLEESRQEKAIAKTDVEIIKIPQEVFAQLLKRNSRASKKAISELGKYFSKFYGKNKE